MRFWNLVVCLLLFTPVVATGTTEVNQFEGSPPETRESATHGYLTVSACLDAAPQDPVAGAAVYVRGPSGSVFGPFETDSEGKAYLEIVNGVGVLGCLRDSVCGDGN